MTLREILAERKRASAEQFKKEFFGEEQPIRKPTMVYVPFTIDRAHDAYYALLDGCEDF